MSRELLKQMKNRVREANANLIDVALDLLDQKDTKIAEQDELILEQSDLIIKLRSELDWAKDCLVHA